MLIHIKKRRAILIDELINDEVNIEQLASRFSVSSSTIRGDLQYLAQNGHIQRTYGGAILNYSNIETTF